MNDLLHEKNGAAICNLFASNDDVKHKLYWAKIQKSFAEKGQIGKHGEMVAGWCDDAITYVKTVAQSMLSDSPDHSQEENNSMIMESYGEMNEHEIILFWNVMEPEMKINIENILHRISE